MKTLKSILLIASFAFMACNKTENTETTITKQTSETPTSDNAAKEDKNEIEKLVKDMYRWNGNGELGYVFNNIVKNSVIVGYDMASREACLKKLRQSRFFAEEFVSNMDKIIKKQDELLRTGKVEWLDGDISPFEVDNANNWCNCQDEPTDNDPYGQTKITFTKLNQEEADIFWKWNVTKDVDPSWAEPKYAIRLVRENGKWKIAWMEGWDYDVNTKAEY